MKYDFDKIVDRKNTASLKWGVAEGELPMWVADMDFETAPEVKEAIKRVADFGVFGYHDVPAEWYSAIAHHWKSRYNFVINEKSLQFTTGVVPAITSMVKRLSNVGDNVVVLTPVYDIFFHSIENTGRHVSESPLCYDGERYEIDFADLEEKLKAPTSTLMIFCNPHNPVGKIWSAEEMERVGRLCKENGVTVISDEIHCDLTAPGKSYIPFASVSEVNKNISVTCLSASKAFNLAGLQSAAVFADNEHIRALIVRGLNSDEVAEPNAFACAGTIAAFTKGDEWLEELREYLFENRKILCDFIKENIPQIKVIKQDATYLVWADVSKITDDAEKLCNFIRKETGLFITAGGQYRGNGKTFVRINIACPRSTLRDGLDRLKRGINTFPKKR